MNADRLLTLYERVAEAPDAITRLRRFVLDLAVRGKLVEQDPADEPASELLERIAAEKARLVKTGKIRKSPPLVPIVPTEPPFAVPSSWEWVSSTYPAYGISDLGKKIKTKDVVESGVFPVVDQGKVLVRRYCNDPRKVIEVYEPLIVFGDHTRETKLIDFDFVVGADGVKILQPVCINAHFYHLVLQWMPLDSRGYGRHFKLLKSSCIPLPPLAEQHRIVAKVDELMALCDRLEEARTAREGTRDRLTKASLARLSAPNTDAVALRSHARFAVEGLPALTARADQVKHLRQTILNLAVRGKLVEQDPADEPAAELIEKAEALMQSLVRSGGASKMKAIASIEQGEQLFHLPTGWSWVRFGRLAKLITKGSSPKWQGIDYVGKDNGVLFITSENVGNYDLTKLDQPKFVERRFNEIEPRSILQTGDLLLNLVGASIGRAAEFHLDRVANINQAVALIRPISLGAFFVNRYVLHYLNSPTGVQEMIGLRVISAQPNISLRDTRNLLIPLPPLAEQRRIVAKLNELMTLCGGLEAALSAADATRSNLLQAILGDILASADDANRGL